MKIIPCDNTAEEVPFNNKKKRSKFNIFEKKKKKRMCKRYISCFLSNTSTRPYLRSWATTKSQFLCMEIICWFNLTGDLL